MVSESVEELYKKTTSVEDVFQDEEKQIENGCTNAEVNVSLRSKIDNLFRNITIEPLLICFIFPLMINFLAIQNLNLEKACRVNLNYGKEVCDKIIHQDVANLTEEVQAIQKAVSVMQLWRAPFHVLLPAIAIIFVGSWSDRSGRRKPFMMLPLVGEIISCVGLITSVYYFNEWPLEVVAIIETIPSTLCGGFAILFMSAFSHLADITESENRTFRFGLASIISSIGLPIGQASSGFIIKYIGYYGVFSLIGSLFSFAFFYTWIRIKDKKNSEYKSTSCCFLEFFNVKYAANTFKILSKPREENKKKNLIVLMVMCVLVHGPIFGEFGIVYFYVRYKFQFDEIDFSLFGAYSSVIHLLGNAFAITILNRRYKVNDYYLGILAGFSKIAGSLVFALSPTVTWFYMGPLIECFSGVNGTVMKSIASKSVDSAEVGRIYSIMGIIDALSPAIYHPLFNAVYQGTISYMPGAFYFIGTTSGFIAIICYLIMLQFDKKSSPSPCTQ